MNNFASRIIITVLLVCSLLGNQAPAVAETSTLETIVYLPAVQKDGVTPSTLNLDVEIRSNCMVTAEGTVKCWGESFTYLEGDVMLPKVNHAVTIPGLSGIKSVAVGRDFACALTNKGGVKCWGQNESGQLGNNTLNSSITPVDVMGLSNNTIAISAGDFFVCALVTGGSVLCWGNNEAGQLGIGDDHNRLTPVEVSAVSGGVTTISAGGYHTCVVLLGGLYCWGSNEFGQVGFEPVVNNVYRMPQPVYGLSSSVVSVAAGLHNTCAVMIGGALKCWGYNLYGQVGNGTSDTNEPLPVDVVGLSNGVKNVRVGPFTTCSTMVDGTARCWGHNDSGQVGTGRITGIINTPVVVNGISSAIEVYPGFTHTCARLQSGSVQCWGDNLYGQLGDGTNASSLTPTMVIE